MDLSLLDLAGALLVGIALGASGAGILLARRRVKPAREAA